MNKPQQKRFDILYQKHVKALKLQGKAKATIDAYSRAKSGTKSAKSGTTHLNPFKREYSPCQNAVSSGKFSQEIQTGRLG